MMVITVMFLCTYCHCPCFSLSPYICTFYMETAMLVTILRLDRGNRYNSTKVHMNIKYY